MASNEEDKEFEEDYSGFGQFEENQPDESVTDPDPREEPQPDESVTDPDPHEEQQPDLDPEFIKHMNEITKQKQKNMYNMLENDEGYDIDKDKATKIVNTCNNKKNRHSALYCRDQIVLKYTKDLINHIIHKLQTYDDGIRLFNKFKEYVTKYTKESIDNIFIYSRVAVFSGFNNKASISKYAINEKFINQKDENNNMIINIIWTYLIFFIDEIKKQNPSLANKYYKKIYIFLNFEEMFLKEKEEKMDYWRKKDIYKGLSDLVDATLSNPSLNDFFKIKKDIDIVGDKSIKTFLSTDCSNLIESSQHTDSTANLYGGRKRRTRRKHFRRGTSSTCKKTHFRRGTTSKCHKTHFSMEQVQKCRKTLKRKGKKTLKRK